MGVSVSPNGWIIRGKSYYNGWFRGTPVSGNLHLPVSGSYQKLLNQFQIEVSLWHWQFSMWLQWVSGFIPHKKPHPSCHDGNQVARHRDCIFCDECTTKALQRALGGKEKNLGKTVRRKPSAFIKHSGLRNPVMKNGNGGSHQTLCWGIFQHDMWLISRG